MTTTSAAVIPALEPWMGEAAALAAMIPGVSPAATTAPTAASVFFPLFLSFIMLSYVSFSINYFKVVFTLKNLEF